MLKSIRSNKGFSLVELMIVVAIIGILASVAIPNFQRFQRKARQSEAKNMLSAYYTSEKAFNSEYNAYAGNFFATGFQPDGKLGYRVATSIDVTAGLNPFTLMGQTASAIQTSCTNTLPTNCPTPAWSEPAVASNVGADTTLLTSGTAATAAGFLGEASGFIGTATADKWTVDQGMNYLNTVSGL